MSESIRTGIKLPPKFKTTSAKEVLENLTNTERAKFIPEVGKEFRIGAGAGTFLVYEVCMLNVGQMRFTCKFTKIQFVEMPGEKQ